jgi:protocatechuate 3,4-dioxygenase beta subunit
MLARVLPLVAALGLATPACAQAPNSTPAARPSLNGCEGCDAVYERPDRDLSWRLTIPSESEPGEPLILAGRTLRADGETPAPGVLLYIHHTNAAGIYPRQPGATGWGVRHGALRGWLVTDAEGRYEIHTIRPAAYPGRAVPAHVHIFVKDAEHPPYYLHDTVFEDDSLVTPAYRASLTDRLDSGILALTRAADGTWRGIRDLILEY